MEREVREMLKSKSSRAPVMEEPPKPVLRRARARKATNSIGLAVVVAILAVGSLVSVRSLVSTEPIEPLTRLPVPWVSIPPSPTGGGIEPCRASDLVFSVAGGPSAEMAFTPRSDLIRCVIDRKLTIELFNDADKKLSVPVGVADRFEDLVVYNREVLRLALFSWTNGCAPTTGPIRFRVTLPNGGGMLEATATRTDSGELGCTGSRSNTTLTIQSGGSASSGYVRHDALDMLTVRLSQMPRSVRAGTELRYVVLLTNATGAAVPLDPCPDYDQTLTVLNNSTSTSVVNKLNCAAAPNSIPARSRLTLEMRFAVPADSNAAPAELSWAFTRPGFGRVDKVTVRFTITR
jgi:hypothetical protein